MRYYDELDDRVVQRLEEIVSNKRLIFATDLVYFISCEYTAGWIPYKVAEGGVSLAVPASCTPHDLSPFTDDMRAVIKHNLRENDHEYWREYNELVPPGTENKLSKFLNHFAGGLNYFLSEKHNSIQLFFSLVYIAKMSVFFHEGFVTEAPYFAVIFIEFILKMLAFYEPEQKFFEEVETFAEDRANLYREEKSKEK